MSEWLLSNTQVTLRRDAGHICFIIDQRAVI